jgi:hypothetical protein
MQKCRRLWPLLLLLLLACGALGFAHQPRGRCKLHLTQSLRRLLLLLYC